jgi:hypothetical protein
MSVSIKITGTVSPAVEVVRWNGSIIPIVNGKYSILKPLNSGSSLINLDLRGPDDVLIEKRVLLVQRTVTQRT